MKKFIVMMAVVAFSALAFGEDAPSTAPAGGAQAPSDSAKTADSANTPKTDKKVAKKGSHHKKASKAASDNKAM